MGTSAVSLPMYPFPGGTEATEALGTAIVRALHHCGVPAHWTTPQGPTHEALEALWLGADLGLSQTCGLPLVETLGTNVQPVGTFLWSGVHSVAGRYRSVIVARQEGWPRSIRPAINGYHSLSGWASLGVYLARNGLPVIAPVVTGSHRESLRAVAQGLADIAAIDTVTWALVRRTAPNDLQQCRVMGDGPELPGLPLIGRTQGIPLEILKSAVFEALDGLEGRQAARALGIDGFVIQGIEEFSTVPGLAREAATILPRPPTFRRYL